MSFVLDVNKAEEILWEGPDVFEKGALRLDSPRHPFRKRHPFNISDLFKREAYAKYGSVVFVSKFFKAEAWSLID